MILVIPCGGGQPAGKETPGSFHHIEEEDDDDDDDGGGGVTIPVSTVNIYVDDRSVQQQVLSIWTVTILLHRIVRYY